MGKHSDTATFDSPSSEALEASSRRRQLREPKHRASGFNSLLSLHGMPTRSPAAKPALIREPSCVANWPECFSGGYDPSCCRFPKSCSVRTIEPNQKSGDPQ